MTSQGYNFIYRAILQKMNQQLNSMNKTQMNMYSTLTPVGVSLRRGEFSNTSRTSRYRRANQSNSFNQEVVNLSSTINKQYNVQAKLALPGLKKQREKGFMLQQWLNDALQGDDGLGIKQPLKTLKKYEMDKGSLRNANMSLQQIKNLYNGLFVYTSGIKNAFEEMFKSASLQNRDDNKIQKTYWKIFIKLLQNTIPVKTCFQIIEDEYRRQISNLKRSLIEQHKKQQKINEQHELQIKRLKKDIEDEQKRYNEFKKDYNVMNSNLILYQQTFNQQVALRLKFEEKINQVYTSYDELKQKYECIRTELSNSRQQLIAVTTQKYSLQTKISQQKIKNDDILLRLQIAQRRLSQRQQDLVIKNQQICDIKMQNHEVDEKKKLQEATLDEMMHKIKLYKKNEIQYLKKIQDLKMVINSNESTIKKLKDTLWDVRDKNDKIYQKLQQISMNNMKIDEQKIRLNLQLQLLKNKLLKQQNRLIIIQSQKDELLIKLSKLDLDIINNNKQIQDKNKTINIYDNNLLEMKATKDRYQRLNYLLKIDIEKYKNQLEEKNKLYNIQQSKVFDLNYQNQKLKKYVLEIQTTVQNWKASYQRKQQQIKEINIVFRNRLTQLQLKIKQKQFDINELKKQISKMTNEMNKHDGQKLNKLDEISYLKKQNIIFEKELKQKKQSIEQILKNNELKILQIQNLKKNIEIKQYIINNKKQQIDGQIINLKLIILKYKKIIQQKKQLIHPMILQDHKSRILQLLNKINQINNKNKYINNNYDTLIEQLQINKINLNRQIQQKNKYKSNLQILMKQSLKRKKQNEDIRNDYEIKLKQKQQNIKKIQQQYIKKQDQLINKLDQKSNKYQQILSINNKLSKQIKIYKQMNQKPNKIDVSIQYQYKQNVKIDISIQTQNNINNMTTSKKIQNISGNNNIQKNHQKQQKSITKIQRQYDKIIDQRQTQNIGITIKNKLQSLSIQEEQQILNNEKKNNGNERKVQGNQFKKALKISYLRK